MYKMLFTADAEDDAVRLKRSDSRAYRKLSALIGELRLHPKTGTGHPEPLKGDRAGQWSRRISSKHSIVYCIDDGVLTVLLLAACGHYDDK